MTERLKDRLEDDKPIELSDVIERFQQQVVLHENDRYSKTPYSHSSFATTFRGESQSPRPKPKCPCGATHFPVACWYMNKERRPEGWKPKEEIQKKMNKMLKENADFKASVYESFKISKEYKEKKEKEEKDKKEGPTSSGKGSTHITCAVKHHVAFSNATESALYRAWIVDSGSDTHVINHSAGFVRTRDPGPNECVQGGRDSYQIEAFGTVDVSLNTPNGPLTITLKEVAFIPGYLTNIISLERMNAVGIHWDSERPTYLKRNGSTFAYLEQVGRHWVVQKDIQFEDYDYGTKSYSVFATKKTRSDRGVRKSTKPLETTITAAMAHNVFGHASPEVIDHLEGSLRGLRIDKSVSAPSNTVKCTSCATSKATEIISRRPDVEVSFDTPGSAWSYDIIPLDTAFNGDKYVSHF